MKEVEQLIKSLPDGHGVLVSFDGDDTVYRAVSPDLIRHLNYFNGAVHIITNQIRPLGGEFISEVEYKMFAPMTPASESFVMHMIKWFDLMWWVASIPAYRLPGVEEIAAQYNFKLCPTVPVAFGKPPFMALASLSLNKKETNMAPKGTSWFPVEINTYTIEKRS